MKFFFLTILKERSTTSTFQFILIFITSIIILRLLYKPLIYFKSYDAAPPIHPILPEQLQKFETKPAKIRLGLYIYDFPKFDFIKNDFSFKGVLFFEFDPTLISVDILGKFSFDKAVKVKKSEPYIKLSSFNSDLIFVRYDIKVDFKTNLDYRLFPLSDHSVNIILDHEFFSSEEILFEASLATFGISSFIDTPGWKEYQRNVRTGYTIAKIEAYNPEVDIYRPRAIFTINYVQSGLRFIISILFPLLLLFFMSNFVFSMDPKTHFGSIISISIGTITGLIAYKYVIDNLSPKVGYFVLTDFIYFIFLFLMIILFVFHIKTQELTAKQKMFISLFSHLILIASFIFIYEFWY